MTEANHLNVYSFSASSITGEAISLDMYRGNVLLIVNTASNCGFTPQYKALETLYRTHQTRGFTILGFPCNQFGAQEPASEPEIAQFCESNYGVSFPVFSKIEVNGPNAHPLFQFLRREKGGILGAIGFNAIKWNFTKFLIDRTGRVAARYAPTTTPAQLAPAVEKLLYNR